MQKVSLAFAFTWPDTSFMLNCFIVSRFGADASLTGEVLGDLAWCGKELEGSLHSNESPR